MSQLHCVCSSSSRAVSDEKNELGKSVVCLGLDDLEGTLGRACSIPLRALVCDCRSKVAMRVRPLPADELGRKMGYTPARERISSDLHCVI